MHAAARAVSGGPVYVSDAPEKHDAALLKKLAFHDGSLPRCIRNARPPAAALYLDPQRRAGDPLLLQNANPAGGLVVAVFNIAGAVLENDREGFRFLRAEEMDWADDDAKARATAAAAAAAAAAASSSSPSSSSSSAPTSLFDDASWSKDLGIEWKVRASDCEEAALELKSITIPADENGATQATVGHDGMMHLPPPPLLLGGGPQWIGYRSSDGELFAPSECVSVSGGGGGVPVSLPRVFDYEIVSFARVLYPSSSMYGGGADGGGGGEVGSEKWAAFIGAVDMLNPGGAVLASMVHEWSGYEQPATDGMVMSAVELEAQRESQMQQIAELQERVAEKLKPRTCPSMLSMLTEIELYEDLWLHQGEEMPSYYPPSAGSAGSDNGGSGVELSGAAREAAENELDASLDQEIADLQAAIETLQSTLRNTPSGHSLLNQFGASGGTGGTGGTGEGGDNGGAATSDQLQHGVVLESDLLGEGRFMFVVHLPTHITGTGLGRCRAQLLMAKSLTYPDPEVKVSARMVEMNGRGGGGGGGALTHAVCVVEMNVGRVLVETEAAGDEVRGLHVSLVVT